MLASSSDFMDELYRTSEMGLSSEQPYLLVIAHASGRTSRIWLHHEALFEKVVIAANDPFAAEYPQPWSTADFR